MSVFQDQWLRTLSGRKDAGLWRQHQVLGSPQGVEVSVDGRQMLAFCSNDYLGLANNPQIKQAAIECIETAGVGSGASHLVIGHHQEHDLLEQELAEFTQRERALVFSSGYMANLALVATLVGKNDVVLEDRLNHASLIDGGLLSGARFQRYQHNNTSSLERYLSRFAENSPTKDSFTTDLSTTGSARKQLVVSDGVFSMDGDIADLSGISAICQQHDALLMVDDAHGLGVLGEKGRGCTAALSQEQVPVLMGTFGKAFGTTGAFVAGSNTLIEYLIQMARPYIYTTAMPPSMAAATRKSLELIQQADVQRAHLSALITRFRQGAIDLGFDLMPSSTPIQPIMIGSSQEAVALSTFLASEGLLVTAIRPPTVPDKTARLRVTISANHQFEHIDSLLFALGKAKALNMLKPRKEI